MIEQERTHQTSDQNTQSQTASSHREIFGEYLLKTESFEFESKTFFAEIARNEQGLIVQLKNMRPENGQQITQNPKRIIRRSRFC